MERGRFLSNKLSFRSLNEDLEMENKNRERLKAAVAALFS